MGRARCEVAPFSRCMMRRLSEQVAACEEEASVCKEMAGKAEGEKEELMKQAQDEMEELMRQAEGEREELMKQAEGEKEELIKQAQDEKEELMRRADGLAERLALERQKHTGETQAISTDIDRLLRAGMPPY